MKWLLVLLILFPAVLCLGMGYSFAESERSFEQGAESVQGTVKAIREATRFNGRDSEDVTIVDVDYKTKENSALTSSTDVGYAVGLSPGKTVEVLYKKAEPQKIQIRAGFLNRSSKVVFFTIFGAFWAVLAMLMLGFLASVKSKAKDPADAERIERMKEELRRKQAGHGD